MTRLLRISGAMALVLLPAQAGHASEPVWCYQVRHGDTLAAIARRAGASVQELRGLNRLAPKAIPSVRSILMLPTVRDLRRGQLDLSRPPMVATPRRLNRESAAATRDRLSRMRDLAMVQRFRRKGLLVPVPSRTGTYYVEGVDPRLRVARPWTRRLIEQMAQAFQDLFARPLRITSLTRTTATQQRLRRTNPSAAPAAGPVRSTHLTGAAVDISKRSLPDSAVAWLRTVLARLQRRGLVHAVEEFREPHFHVMVRRAYDEYARALRSPILAGGC
jgi:murein DD-endopeptidase MepM/ murein hydrolase activator NlpD